MVLFLGFARKREELEEETKKRERERERRIRRRRKKQRNFRGKYEGFRLEMKKKMLHTI